MPDRSPLAGGFSSLHGFPQDNDSWLGIEPLLHAAGLRTLAFDQRDYSPRARPRGGGSTPATSLQTTSSRCSMPLDWSLRMSSATTGVALWPGAWPATIRIAYLGRYAAAAATTKYVKADHRFVEVSGNHWLPETRSAEMAKLINERAGAAVPA